MDNWLKAALTRGTSPLGTWISIGHPAVVEVNAFIGFDFVLIDSEHTSMSLETIESLVRAAHASSDATDPVVRVPDNDPVRIKRILDIGVSNLMIPMVDSATEARSLVEAVRYPPGGQRGIAASRATDYGRNFADYVAEANQTICTIAQIETEEGLDNAVEIGAVDGIDALFVGPADLSGSLDMFGQWESNELTKAIEQVLEAGDETGVPVGTLTVDPETIPQHLEQGFDFLIAGKDTSHLIDAGEDVRRRYEQALDRDDRNHTTKPD